MQPARSCIRPGAAPRPLRIRRTAATRRTRPHWATARPRRTTNTTTWRAARTATTPQQLIIICTRQQLLRHMEWRRREVPPIMTMWTIVTLEPRLVPWAVLPRRQWLVGRAAIWPAIIISTMSSRPPSWWPHPERKRSLWSRTHTAHSRHHRWSFVGIYIEKTLN